VHKAGDTENYTNTSGVSGEWSPFVQLRWDGTEFTITQGWGDRPFVQVTWYGAAAFANWKSAEAGLTPCYDLETWECNFDADGFRLPTEAEWEKASRGGHHDPYYTYSWGSNTTINDEGNFLGSGDPYEEEIPATTPVGYYDTPNGYGLFDMAGNVWEWCNDWWDYDYPSESPYDNPRGPEKGVIKVNRGGGFHSRPSVNSRNATRCNGCHELNTPASGNIIGFNVGFRLARTETATDVSSADFTGDGKVDFSDFLLFAQHFGQSSSLPQFEAKYDLDSDGRIDFDDFVIFAQAFGRRV